MGSALQTALCNSQGHRNAAYNPLSPRLLFDTSLTVLKINAPGSSGPEGGGTLGSLVGDHAFPRRQEGAAAGSLKTR